MYSLELSKTLTDIIIVCYKLLLLVHIFIFSTRTRGPESCQFNYVDYVVQVRLNTLIPSTLQPPIHPDNPTPHRTTDHI